MKNKITQGVQKGVTNITFFYVLQDDLLSLVILVNILKSIITIFAGYHDLITPTVDNKVI